MTFRRGYLSDYFIGVGAKRLAPVDTPSAGSNQHEVNGSKEFRRLLGDRQRRANRGTGPDERFLAEFIWLGAEQETLSESGRVSWYDTRRNQPHRAAEWRLYYQSNPVTDLMKPGDSLFIALRTNDTLLLIVAPEGSTMERQLLWLFGLPDQIGLAFELRDQTQFDAEIDFAVTFILDEINVELEDADPAVLDNLLRDIGPGFPTTAVMSALARASSPSIDLRTAPDLALTSWLEQEERLFRRLERRIISERLAEGFITNDVADIEGFLDFSKSVQNRRKARMGLSLENHLDFIFAQTGISYERGAQTEGKSRPDFLFPSRGAYHDHLFPASRLAMLAAKSTCKDRWRQVLAEAARIPRKHLITLEPSISEAQTDEMKSQQIQLVLPEALHATYTLPQRSWLLTLREFIAYIRNL